MYKPRLSRKEKLMFLRLRWLIAAAGIVAVALVIWLAFASSSRQGADTGSSKITDDVSRLGKDRPQQGIASFAECVAAGNLVQESSPEVCVTEDGRRFVNTDYSDQSDQSRRYLDIKEWNVRVPLTPETYDLTYFYDEQSEVVRFAYKRLADAGICSNDIGVTLERSPEPERQRQGAPEPIAKVDGQAFYAQYASRPCYDWKDDDQVRLVKMIAGDLTLIQATANLLADIEPL